MLEVRGVTKRCGALTAVQKAWEKQAAVKVGAGELSEAAAARKRWDFMRTMAPIPVVGGTGSPINPIATF